MKFHLSIRKLIFKPLIYLLFSTSVFAEQIDLPVVETPFNRESAGAWPSMNQSLLLSSDFYQVLNLWTERKLEAGGATFTQQRFAIVGLDLLSFYLPLGNSWMHEEWHRAVMTHRQIGSFNDVYYMKFFGEAISVSHVTDEGLIRLKRDHPADLVRLEAAGIESQTAQNLYLEKQKFFFGGQAWTEPILFANDVGNLLYLHSCNSSSSTEDTHRFNQEDGTDVARRDFTGLDCLGWVYDLFRPDEPYQARGTHPSGVGINRYRTLEDLTTAEKEFLRKQDYLGLLNLVDPFLFQKNQWNGVDQNGQTFAWNFKLQHYLTSFGYDIDFVLFYKQMERKFIFKWQHFFNETHYFPGFSFEFLAWPLAENWSLSSLFSIWQQPENQRYDDVHGRWGGLIQEKISVKIQEEWEPYIFIQAKDQGWVAGEVALDPALTAGLGFLVEF